MCERSAAWAVRSAAVTRAKQGVSRVPVDDLMSFSCNSYRKNRYVYEYTMIRNGRQIQKALAPNGHAAGEGRMRIYRGQSRGVFFCRIHGVNVISGSPCTTRHTALNEWQQSVTLFSRPNPCFWQYSRGGGQQFLLGASFAEHELCVVVWLQLKGGGGVGGSCWMHMSAE